MSGIVRVNELNSDFIRERDGSEQAKLANATLMIGKEVIAYSDKSKTTDYFLEKLLSYLFQVKESTGEDLTKRKSRKVRSQSSNKKGIHKQMPLDLSIPSETTP